jgi:hypothetical protein
MGAMGLAAQPAAAENNSSLAPLTFNFINFNVGIGFGAVVRQDFGEFGAGLLGGGEVHVCKLTHPKYRVNMPFGLYP